MVGGYNALSSYLSRGTVIVKKRLLGIFLPYVLATIIYVAYMEHFLDAENVLFHLLRFDASGPLYYVAVYMQLVLITPMIIGILSWCEERYNAIRFVFIFTLIVLICVFSIHYTNIFDIKIGGVCICGTLVTVLVYRNDNQESRVPF